MLYVRVVMFIVTFTFFSIVATGQEEKPASSPALDLIGPDDLAALVLSLDNAVDTDREAKATIAKYIADRILLDNDDVISISLDHWKIYFKTLGDNFDDAQKLALANVFKTSYVTGVNAVLLPELKDHIRLTEVLSVLGDYTYHQTLSDRLVDQKAYEGLDIENLAIALDQITEPASYNVTSAVELAGYLISQRLTDADEIRKVKTENWKNIAWHLRHDLGNDDRKKLSEALNNAFIVEQAKISLAEAVDLADVRAFLKDTGQSKEILSLVNDEHELQDLDSYRLNRLAYYLSLFKDEGADARSRVATYFINNYDRLSASLGSDKLWRISSNLGDGFSKEDAAIFAGRLYDKYVNGEADMQPSVAVELASSLLDLGDRRGPALAADIVQKSDAWKQLGVARKSRLMQLIVALAGKSHPSYKIVTKHLYEDCICGDDYAAISLTDNAAIAYRVAKDLSIEQRDQWRSRFRQIHCREGVEQQVNSPDGIVSIIDTLSNLGDPDAELMVAENCLNYPGWIHFPQARLRHYAVLLMWSGDKGKAARKYAAKKILEERLKSPEKAKRISLKNLAAITGSLAGDMDPFDKIQWADLVGRYYVEDNAVYESLGFDGIHDLAEIFAKLDSWRRAKVQALRLYEMFCEIESPGYDQLYHAAEALYGTKLTGDGKGYMEVAQALVGMSKSASFKINSDIHFMVLGSTLGTTATKDLVMSAIVSQDGIPVLDLIKCVSCCNYDTKSKTKWLYRLSQEIESSESSDIKAIWMAAYAHAIEFLRQESEKTPEQWLQEAIEIADSDTIKKQCFDDLAAYYINTIQLSKIDSLYENIETIFSDAAVIDEVRASRIKAESRRADMAVYAYRIERDKLASLQAASTDSPDSDSFVETIGDVEKIKQEYLQWLK